MNTPKIYVGNLAYSVTEDNLREYFGTFGKVEQVRIILDDMGRSKGFAFITFGSTDESKKALDANGKDLSGRTLKVSEARDNRGRPPRD